MYRLCRACMMMVGSTSLWCCHQTVPQDHSALSHLLLVLAGVGQHGGDVEHDLVALEHCVHRVCPSGVVWRRGKRGGGDERWELGDGRWEMGVGRWELGDGTRCGGGEGEFEVVYLLLDIVSANCHHYLVRSAWALGLKGISLNVLLLSRPPL